VFSSSNKGIILLNVGEQLVASYLRYIRHCDFIQTNLYTGEKQGEIDVVGINLKEKQVYVCEVAAHTNGLRYTDKNGKTNNVPKLTDKFSKNIEYANKYLSDYSHHFMLWSPIVKNNGGKVSDNQLAHLDEIKANIKARYEVELECVVNETFRAYFQEMRDFARSETAEFKCPVMRLLQIEKRLNEYLAKPSPKTRKEKPITTADIDELLAYLPRLRSLEGRYWEESATSYVPVVEEFFNLAGKGCWYDSNYQPEKADQMIEDTEHINNATIGDIKTMLAWCVRGERFCEGHWAVVLSSGKVFSILERCFWAHVCLQ
jgi:hypothetical protein